MRTILITGSAGFVGSHLVEHILQETDWNIVGLDSLRHRGDTERLSNNTQRYRFETVDLAAPISYRVAEKIGAVDWIVNMASESHVDRSIVQPVEFCQNNVNLALYMLELSKFMNPKKFIQISTDEVYGAAPEGTDHEEWSPILPSNPYAASKACQEALAISWWRTYDVPLIITNTMNMYGERQDKEKFIPMLISKVNNGETVTIHGSPDYIGKRHYLHARNFADALVYLIKENSVTHYKDGHEIIKPNRFNVVGDMELDNLEVAKAVSHILGKPLHYELMDFHNARPGHDRRYSLDGTKMADFGWKQPKDFHTALSKTIEWTLKHPEWLK